METHMDKYRCVKNILFIYLICLWRTANWEPKHKYENLLFWWIKKQEGQRYLEKLSTRIPIHVNLSLRGWWWLLEIILSYCKKKKTADKNIIIVKTTMY